MSTGAAGASARREYERRHRASWLRGAEGEEAVARRLARLCCPDVVVLHDRRMPGSRANIDHIAVARSGVWEIDTKRYAGKVQVRRGRLVVDGRDRTRIVDGLEKQIAAVRDVVRERVPVSGVLCFRDADLPLLGTLRVGGHELLRTRTLARRLNRDGPLGEHVIDALAAELQLRFPSA